MYHRVRVGFAFLSYRLQGSVPVSAALLISPRSCCSGKTTLPIIWYTKILLSSEVFCRYVSSRRKSMTVLRRTSSLDCFPKRTNRFCLSSNSQIRDQMRLPPSAAGRGAGSTSLTACRLFLCFRGDRWRGDTGAVFFLAISYELEREREKQARAECSKDSGNL
ncbi:hypothetical protein DFH09DRAFT_1125892 [Mycena vulgaris]|nr:hypothetical protein DFH09DRAFT_1125892 [Mycena vulgaris]